jgi:peptidoglycan/LPS O-acetylase OafA/YrhL
LRYNPALDGLRAVAIALVLSSHTMRFVTGGGWIGVDVFFVLSGYLITSILLRELRSTGAIDFRSFSIRRSLRLTPALAILLAFEMARSSFAHGGAEIREQAIVAGAYLEDFNVAFGWHDPGLVAPTWSLAVEEQFYLLWPFVLGILFTRRPVRWLCAAMVAMTIARIEFRYDENLIQALPMIRPVGLLVGCALAFAPQWRVPSWTGIAALLAIVAIALTNESLPLLYLAAPALVSIATAALIASTWQPGSISAALSFLPLRYVGRISYGIYLFHFPIFMLGEQHKVHLPFGLFGALLIALVFLAAAASYEFVEKPILQIKGRFYRAPEPTGEGLKPAC